ncbi:hypothetical protein ACSVH2_06400 [Flavobacterium sp. RSB2_4_14]|uniref:hypothetical protein n=1 Tax=Flavobacterium sp. RSB2_4_14 TaxID=3447665 RepID=UPI003F4001EE
MKSKFVFRKDATQTKTLVKAGKESAKNALRASRALGISVSYIENGILYEERADGQVEEIQKLAEPKEAPFTLTKGMVLHAK